MIYEAPPNKKTRFKVLMNYYINDSELKRFKENKGNSKYN